MPAYGPEILEIEPVDRLESGDRRITRGEPTAPVDRPPVTGVLPQPDLPVHTHRDRMAADRAPASKQADAPRGIPTLGDHLLPDARAVGHERPAVVPDDHPGRAR